MNIEFEKKLSTTRSFNELATARAEVTRSFAEYINSYKNTITAKMADDKAKADEKAAEEAKKKKEERIDELIAMIGRLRQKLFLGGGENAAISAQIAQLESELTMLLLLG